MPRPPDVPTPRALPGDFAEAMARVRNRLGPFAANVLSFGTVGSTNDLADLLARDGAPEGTTVIAEAQTAGRGRMGRTWVSPPCAGLYVSFVVRPDRAEPVPLLTLVVGVALAEALRTATGLPVTIKWPNDLMVGRRKVGGILAEAAAGSSSRPHVIVGFGINLLPAAYPAEVAGRATSLEAELGRPVDRGVVLAEALSELATRIGDLRAGRFDGILTRWTELAPSSTGAAVEWTAAGAVCRGVTAGIGHDGALLVRSGDRMSRLVAGEVRWLD